MDATFDFEKRRNRPIKYDRDLVGSTVRAMKKVQEVQATRQARFYKNRMKPAKDLAKLRARKEIVQNIDLIAPAASKQRQKTNVVETAKQGVAKRSARIKALRMGD